MEENRKTSTIEIIGGIVIAVSVAVFFLLDIEKTDTYWLSFSFMLLSEVVFFVGLKLASRLNSYSNHLFVKSGISVTLSLYLLLSLILNIFSSTFTDDINTFIIFHILLFSITAIVAIIILAFSQRINRLEQSTVRERRILEICESKMNNLLSDSNNSPYIKSLNTIYENIRYGNKTYSSSADEKILAATFKLENALYSNEKSNEQILSIISEISAFLAIRNTEIPSSKRGGF